MKEILYVSYFTSYDEEKVIWKNITDLFIYSHSNNIDK